MVIISTRDVLLLGGLLVRTSLGQLFTVNCAPLTVFRGDPIVNPGVLSSHVHAVVGGTRFDLTLSNEQARNARATTCDKTMDKSNYWQPQLYHQRRDGRFELVEMTGITAYYIERACDYAPGRQNCDTAGRPRAPPKGLRMLTGDLNRRDYDASRIDHRAISHVCLGNNRPGERPNLPTWKCDNMRTQTFFPSCWNGRDLDSGDHRSHMAFPAIGDYNNGVCPESHPFAIFSVFTEFFYETGAIKDFNMLTWAMGDPTGYGLHGDFLNGWTDQDALQSGMHTCTGPRGVQDPKCSFNVGNDGPGHADKQMLEVAPPNEEVGFRGPLDRLPGDNPLRGQPIY